MKCKTSLLVMLLVGLFSLLLAGCSTSKTVSFINYPGFWTQPNDYTNITVAPVTNDQYPGQYVTTAADDIISRLQNNNHYNIYNYTGSIDYNSLNEDEAELVAYTTINSYSVDRGMDRRTRTEQRKRINEETGEEYTVDVEVPYDYHWQNSYANVTMTLYSSRAGNGVLKSFNRDGSCSDSDETPPRHHPNLYSPESMERCAIKNALGKLVYQVTPTYEYSILEPDETLMVYQVKKDEWKQVSKVKEKYGEDFRIYLKLPSKADMNDFVLEVVADDKEKTLIKSWDVHWDATYSRLYYTVNMYEFYTLSGGSTKFIIRLKSRLVNDIVIENDFKLSFNDEDVAKARLASSLTPETVE